MKTMRKLFFALMCLASLTIVTACGGGSNKSAAEGDSTESATGGGSLVDGKWPAAIYDKYGISEIPTKGKIVYTDFASDGSYQYLVAYKNVTKEEVLAWVNSLKEKGFRISARDDERLAKKPYDHDIMIYQPE